MTFQGKAGAFFFVATVMCGGAAAVAGEVGPPTPKPEKTVKDESSRRLLKWAEDNLDAGRYAAGVELLQRASAALRREGAAKKEQAAVKLRLARALRIVGRYDEAQRLCEKLYVGGKGDAAAGCLLGELLWTRGQYKKAAALFDSLIEAEPQNLRARAFRGRLAAYLGDKKTVGKVADFFFKYYEDHFDEFNEGKIKDPKIPAYVAQGIREDNPKSAFEVGFMLAEELAKKRKQKDPEVFMWAAELAAEKYSFANAWPRCAAVLKMRPRFPDALVLQAEMIYTIRHDYRRAAAALKAALSVNPHHVDAHLLQAVLDLQEDNYSSAERHVRAALAVNPNHLEALAVQAFMYRDRKRFADEADAEKRALAVNPKPVAYYCRVGELLETKRGYEDAPRYYRKALALDPDGWRPLYDLGMNLSRQGRNREARELLLRAFHRNRFNVWAKNMITVLDKILGDEEQGVPPLFVELKTKHFSIRCLKKEAEVVGPYARKWAENIYAKETKQFDFVPRGPLSIEIMSQRDQSARTVGLPGLPALGVCFGKLFTVVTPGDVERHNWRKTLEHEFTHVMTLQMSDYRIPRWMTEAYSVYAEGNTRTNSDFLLLSLARHGRLKPLADMGQYFRSGMGLPAYLHGPHVIDYLVKNFGFTVNRKILRLLSEGRELARVFPAALGKSLAEVDEGQRRHLEEFLSRVRLHPAVDRADFVRLELAARGADAPARALAALAYAYLVARRPNSAAADALLDRALLKDPGCVEALLLDGRRLYLRRKYTTAKKRFESVVRLKPDFSAYAWVRLAVLYNKEGRLKKALEACAHARRLYPRMVGTRNPRRVLRVAPEESPLHLQAAIYLEMEPPRRREALKAYRAAVNLEANDLEAAAAGLKLASELKDWPAALRFAEDCFAVKPFKAEQHRAAWRAAAALKDWKTAAREARVWTALEKEALPAWIARARAEARAGDREAAVRSVKQALKLGKDDADVKKLATELEVPF